METPVPSGRAGPADEIAATDIIFECPHCAKSLAIDERGAGLMILCPDCGTRIQVPYPEGGEDGEPLPESPDGEESAQDHQLRNLAQALTHSRAKVQQLMQHLDEVRKRRGALEKARIDQLSRVKKVSDELTVIQSAVDRIGAELQDALAELKDDGAEW